MAVLLTHSGNKQNSETRYLGILDERLKTGLAQMTDEEQPEFFKGRHISNKIRLVLDMVDYSNYILD